MKKLYTLFVMLIALCGIQANAFNVVLKADASGVVGWYASFDWTGSVLEEGENVIDCGDITSAVIYPFVQSTDYDILSVVDLNTGDECIKDWGTWAIPVSPEVADHVFEITTVNKNAARTGHMRVFCDNPAEVQAIRTNDYSEITFQEGWQDFYFIPGVELTIMVNTVNWEKNLYMVRANGVVLQADWGAYYVDLEEGMELEIFANFPDGPSHVAFTFTNPGTEACVNKVYMNQEQVENWAAGIDCRLGDSFNISFDTSNYNIESLKINGVEQELYGSLSLMATEADYVIEITASEYEKFNITLDVDQPEAVYVYIGSSYGTPIDVEAGEHTIAVSQNAASMTVRKRSGIDEITEITCNGEPVEYLEYMNGYTIYTLNEGDKIVVRATHGERNEVAYVWVDEPWRAPYGAGMSRSDNSMWDDSPNGYIGSRYNKVVFNEALDNPFQLGLWGLTDFWVYDKDGNPILRESNLDSYINLTLKDGDVVKAFLVAEPEVKTVAVSIQNAEPTITYDKILTLAGDELKCFAGTEIAVSDLKADDKVLIDDVETPAVDGQVVFVVSGDHKVEVSGQSGVANVALDGQLNGNVYNLQGQLVGKDGSTANLPAGLYIANGKKVLVK